MNTQNLKKIFTTLLILCTISIWAQDKAGISGTIVLNDNTAAESISVELKGTNYSATTNVNGVYEIKNIKPGTYVIRISAIGIMAVEESFTLAQGEQATKNFTLSESAEQIKEVVIESQGNKFARQTSEVVSKMPLKDLENPQVYNTISAELLKEQVITNFDDALKNAPGIDKLWESTG
ncbi:MAG: carboxypeptidase-like regulatory domain-containing protein, partial [Bacteroidota bacterium]